MVSDPKDDQKPNRRRRGRRGRVLLLLIGIWLGAGLLRAETVARSYWANAHNAGATTAHVQVTFQSPFIPPFWWVSINGEVSEPQMGAGQGYDSAMLLVVEPIIGLVFVFGRG